MYKILETKELAANIFLMVVEAKRVAKACQPGQFVIVIPLVDREQAEVAETRSFLDRVYRGSVGMMMSAMAQRQELSGDEIAEASVPAHRALQLAYNLHGRPGALLPQAAQDVPLR